MMNEPTDGNKINPTKLVAAIVNEDGHILPYTARSYVEQCEEFAVEFWGEELWDRLQEMGARILLCHMTVVDDPQEQLEVLAIQANARKRRLNK